ncbi:uncharacterized protein ColSpa_06199 [Colletotrichum spaethianum]|uniref:Uncharacterized protein n=1 Tax=Colletotrichum spaethianum TaxID=700344 RepID=A0AA37LCR7_9PEZI|nr:uncharacterized protein ColSpa_06199 [Colletotrichum spaethianum]GKT46018.1 hypothetical protein ColSpa_06199 [Colletotrichum spaethianum]
MPAFGKDERKEMDDEIYVNLTFAGVDGMLMPANTARRVIATNSIVAVAQIECFLGKGLGRPAFDGEYRVATPVAPYGSGFGPYEGAPPRVRPHLDRADVDLGLLRRALYDCRIVPIRF